jgi:hypothetical protein
LEIKFASLKNQEHFNTLSKKGVVKMPFLNDEELDEIRALYQEMHGTSDPPTLYNGIHMTIWHSDTEYKLKINRRLSEIIEPACERTFENYRALSQQFIVKMKGNQTTFPIHQDWSIVDETKYLSFNLWIPIYDVNENNGAMWIVEGSHNIKRKVRGAGYLFPNYYEVLDELRPYMTSYSVKAGEALLFFHNTIHGSPHNNTEQPRIVAQISVIPKDAPMQIYFQNGPNSQLEVHRPADDFTFHYDKIREESETRPPTDRPYELRTGLSVKPVELDEVIDAISRSVL